MRSPVVPLFDRWLGAVTGLLIGEVVGRIAGEKPHLQALSPNVLKHFVDRLVYWSHVCTQVRMTIDQTGFARSSRVAVCEPSPTSVSRSTSGSIPTSSVGLEVWQYWLQQTPRPTGQTTEPELRSSASSPESLGFDLSDFSCAMTLITLGFADSPQVLEAWLADLPTLLCELNLPIAAQVMPAIAPPYIARLWSALTGQTTLPAWGHPSKLAVTDLAATDWMATDLSAAGFDPTDRAENEVAKHLAAPDLATDSVMPFGMPMAYLRMLANTQAAYQQGLGYRRAAQWLQFQEFQFQERQFHLSGVDLPELPDLSDLSGLMVGQACLGAMFGAKSGLSVFPASYRSFDLEPLRQAIAPLWQAWCGRSQVSLTRPGLTAHPNSPLDVSSTLTPAWQGMGEIIDQAGVMQAR